MNDILGSNIMRLRKEHGLTQEQLATALGISYQAVSKWETGNSCPDISTLPLLADLFCVSIDELFGRAARVPALIPAVDQPGTDLPWPDDDCFYVVLYHGHELIGSGGEDQLSHGKEFRFQYEGPAKDIVSSISVSVDGPVAGSVQAGTSVSCDAVGGDLIAGGGVNCDAVGGDVDAAGSVNCDDVHGSVRAGGNVTCDDVAGDVVAGGSVTCDDVGGDVSAGGSVNSGDAFSFDSREFEEKMNALGQRLSETFSGLGEKISREAERSAGKGWSLHRIWPFGSGEIKVDVDLDPDPDEDKTEE